MILYGKKWVTVLCTVNEVKKFQAKAWTKNPSPCEPKGFLSTYMYLNLLYHNLFINSFSSGLIVCLFQNKHLIFVPSEHKICKFIGIGFPLLWKKVSWFCKSLWFLISLFRWAQTLWRQLETFSVRHKWAETEIYSFTYSIFSKSPR